MSNYILSLKHSPNGNKAVWWRPNAAGYTTKLEEAGKFSDEQVSKNPMYYNNGRTTMAIPVSDVEKLSHRSVDWSRVNFTVTASTQIKSDKQEIWRNIREFWQQHGSAPKLLK